jgi:uncharacterized protein (UPF0276 family)
LIRVAEIEPQTLWVKSTCPGAAPRGSEAQLGDLAALPQAKLLHGIGSPLGGLAGGQQAHVEEFRRWGDRLSVPWTSEHLSILDVEGRSGPRSCGFLMPPLQTEAGVALAARNIAAWRSATGRPFAFETGVNYFAPRPGEMPDGEFFAAVAETADCGVLLDLNNLWVNHLNGRCSIDRVLDALPLERVWEVHLAGAEFARGFWLDAHCGAIDPALAAIAAEVMPDLPNLGAIVFEVAPDRIAQFPGHEVLRQVETLHRLWGRSGGVSRPSPRPRETAPMAGDSPSPAAWERLIAQRMLPDGDRPPGEPQVPLTDSDEDSFRLYAELAGAFRRGAVSGLLNNSIRLLLIASGEQATQALLDAYAAGAPPALFPSDEALAFKRFIDGRTGLPPGLADVLRFEAALIESVVDSRTLRVALTCDLLALLADIAAGRPAAPRPGGGSMVWEVGADPEPFVRQIARAPRALVD